MQARTPDARQRSPETEYAIDLLRAFGGALIFAFPLLMTMEMWELGAAMSPFRLFLFLALNLLVLFGLSVFAGFRRSFSLKEDALDAFAAYGVGILTGAAMLTLFGVLEDGMTWSEMLGKVAIQAIPASIGAMAARKQLGDDDARDSEIGYAGQLFLMVAGALFLSFNVGPTEEMVLISYKMSGWHGLALILASLALLHSFVFSLEFSGQQEAPPGGGFWRSFLGHSVPGYGIALLVSLYVLWSFGRVDGADWGHVAMMVTVLGFPAALGAALARLVV